MGVLILVAWGCALCIFDVRYKRLPNFLTLPAAAVSLLWFSPAGLVWPGLYVALAIGTKTGSVGGGDVKLAVPLGMLTAHAFGVMGVLGAMMGASLGTVVWGLVTRDKAPPHGPGMLLVAALVVIFSPNTV